MGRHLSTAVLVLALALAAVGAALEAQEVPFMEYARVDPAKVMTVERCGECHVSAFEVWKETAHATTFKTMHRKERAETIAANLGFGLIKRDAFCFSCHYTPVLDGDKIRVVSGVSCESCHGAGADWIEVHNDYGEGQTFATESPAHRSERITRSRAAGMRRPSDLYDVAANCFGCHSVPNEDLVNIGGHSTGTAGFELVAWTEGEMRHNFLESFKRGEIGPNATRSPSRLRVMYIAGRALDLEYSLRGAAVAGSEGIYAKAMARRVRSAAGELRAVSAAAPVAEVASMLAVVKGVRVAPGNEVALLAAADAVERETRAFLARADDAVGERLAALDPLLAGESPAVEVAELDTTQTGSTLADADTGSVAAAASPPGEASSASTGSESPAAAAPTAATRAPTAPGVVGELKRHIRPASEHATLGSNVCSGCHESQNAWWFGHAHYRSADPFFEGAVKNQQVARLYGIRPEEATTGRQICMDCHGTVVSGKESRDVLDGVSCESCHGAAGDWLEPHKDETNKQLRRERPGYKAALARGKRPLDNLATRAEVCTGCHYITEPRLLSAGHPSGVDFDYAAGMKAVRHWQDVVPEARIASAFGARLAARGAVPKVPVAVLAQAATSEVTSGAGSPAPTPTARAAARGEQAVARRAAAGLRPPAPRPVLDSPTFDVALPVTATGVELPPFPEIDASTPVEDALLEIKQRLELLYRSVGAQTENGR